MIPAQWDWPEHVSGTTFRPKSFVISIRSAGETDAELIDLTDAYARLTFKDRNGDVALDGDSEEIDWISAGHPDVAEPNGLIEIDEDASEIRIVGPGILTVAEAGELRFNLKLWLNTGVVWSLFRGVMPVRFGQTP
jgi:hypothetical protein